MAGLDGTVGEVSQRSTDDRAPARGSPIRRQVTAIFRVTALESQHDTPSRRASPERQRMLRAAPSGALKHGCRPPHPGVKPQVRTLGSASDSLHVVRRRKQVERTEQTQKKPQVRSPIGLAPESPRTPHDASSERCRLRRGPERCRSGPFCGLLYRLRVPGASNERHGQQPIPSYGETGQAAPTRSRRFSQLARPAWARDGAAPARKWPGIAPFPSSSPLPRRGRLCPAMQMALVGLAGDGGPGVMLING